jgi:hypothetical protein
MQHVGLYVDQFQRMIEANMFIAPYSFIHHNQGMDPAWHEDVHLLPRWQGIDLAVIVDVQNCWPSGLQGTMCQVQAQRP